MQNVVYSDGSLKLEAYIEHYICINVCSSYEVSNRTSFENIFQVSAYLKKKNNARLIYDLSYLNISVNVNKDEEEESTFLEEVHNAIQ